MTFVFYSIGHICSVDRTVTAIDVGESLVVVVPEALGRHVAGMTKGFLLSSIGLVRPSSFESSISRPHHSIVLGLS